MSTDEFFFLFSLLLRPRHQERNAILLKIILINSMQIMKYFSFSMSCLKLETKSQPFLQWALPFPVKYDCFLNQKACTNKIILYVILFTGQFSKMHIISNLCYVLKCSGFFHFQVHVFKCVFVSLWVFFMLLYIG